MLKTLYQFFLLFFFVCPLFAAPSFAQSVPQNERAKLIKQAENYFAGLTTASARFQQTAPDGTQTSGTFSLSRPGKLRFQYDAPLKDFIVADGTFIYFYDGKLKQQSNAPISQTLADFLLRKNLKLTNDLRVTSLRRGGGLLQMSIVQSASPASGTLTLGFEEKPFALKKWRITDATGAITEIELYDMKRNVKFPRGHFSFIDPVKKGLN